MKPKGSTLLTLAGFFAVLSLFAIGGGNSAVPEMHRYSVDVQHWLSDRQFADTPLRWRSSHRDRISSSWR